MAVPVEWSWKVWVNSTIAKQQQKTTKGKLWDNISLGIYSDTPQLAHEIWGIQCNAIITRSIFFKIIIIDTPKLAHEGERGMGCLLWVWSLIYIILLSSQCRMWYHDKLYCVTMALDYILWLQILIYVLYQFLKCCMQCHVILDHIIMATDCILAACKICAFYFVPAKE